MNANPNIQPVPLDVAEKVLLDAGDAVRQRLKAHGHTERSFKMIGELWCVYITHAFTIRGETVIQPRDVAQMMALVKIARSVYGYSEDNFVDNAGYTALAAMLTPVPADKVIITKEKTMGEMFPKKDEPTTTAKNTSDKLAAAKI